MDSRNFLLCFIGCVTTVLPAVGGSAPAPGAAALAQAPIAGDPGAWPGQLIVKWAEPLTPRASADVCRALGLRWIGRAWDGAFDTVGTAPGAEAAAIALLEGLSVVVYAERDLVCVASGLPTDPRYPNQWNMYDIGRASGTKISNFGVQGEAAWAAGATGAGVYVAVLDTGVAFADGTYDGVTYKQAPDLKGVTFVAPRRFYLNGSGSNPDAFDGHGHGTHVCGTISAQHDNGVTAAGLAAGATIIPVKVLNDQGAGTVSSVSQGISWAQANGAFVINMSLVFTQHSKTLANAVNDAWRKGVVLCAAAGNDGVNRCYFPAAYEKVIAVGATDFVGARTGYSNFGVDLDVVAPGGDTAVDLNQDGVDDGIVQQTITPGDPTTFADASYEGTSMATPHVAACAALVKQKHAAFTNKQVRAAIEATCRDLGPAGVDPDFGAGLIDCKAAIQ